MTAPRVGFVGLGSQGGPMAQQVIDAGLATTLWARRPETLASFATGPAQIALTPNELGRASEILCVCVVDDAGVDEVLRGRDGALAGMAAGGIVVIHSTTRPETCRQLQADFPALRFLDAPVSGGGGRAAEGQLLVMVGGDAAVVDEALPVLASFGDPVVYLGTLGSGQEAKLLNNALFTAQLALASDVFDIARKRKMDVAGLSAVLRDGSARSYAGDIISGVGHRIDAIAAIAGPLLAKDVGILSGLLSPERPLLVDVAAVGIRGMTETRSEVDPEE